MIAVAFALLLSAQAASPGASSSGFLACVPDALSEAAHCLKGALRPGFVSELREADYDLISIDSRFRAVEDDITSAWKTASIKSDYEKSGFSRETLGAVALQELWLNENGCRRDVPARVSVDRSMSANDEWTKLSRADPANANVLIDPVGFRVATFHPNCSKRAAVN